MKVVHLACNAPPRHGGIGMAALREVRGLNQRGIEAELWVPAYAGIQYQDACIKAIKIKKTFGNAAWLDLNVDDFKKFDVIHLHYPFYGVAEWLAYHSKKLPPIVMTFHMDATANDWREIVFKLHRLCLQKWIIGKMYKILVSSLDYAQNSSLGENVKIIEAPFGIDEKKFFPDESRRELKRLLFVGGLDKAHEFKGLPVLFKALIMINDSYNLRIVGDGELKSEYEKQAQTLIKHKVEFLGNLDYASLLNEYQSAQILVFPSTSKAEAFGLVALEAMTCQTSVIASNWPGVRTIVREGITGRLVPPNNVQKLAEVLKEVLNDKNECERLGKNGREMVLNGYTEEKHIERLLSAYNEVLKI